MKQRLSLSVSAECLFSLSSSLLPSFLTLSLSSCCYAASGAAAEPIHRPHGSLSDAFVAGDAFAPLSDYKWADSLEDAVTSASGRAVW